MCYKQKSCQWNVLTRTNNKTVIMLVETTVEKCEGRNIRRSPGDGRSKETLTLLKSV